MPYSIYRYEELKQEYEEFRKSSHEYERELELQGDQLEKKVSSLQVARQRLENEVETMRIRFSESQDASRRQIGNLQDELSRAQGEISEKSEYIRKLELTNDDLERAKRALEMNCDDLERQLETTLEQNAFLQSELDERESVCLLIQHLREELRDVQRENDILRARISGNRSRCSTSISETTCTNGIAQSGGNEQPSQTNCDNREESGEVASESLTENSATKAIAISSGNRSGNDEETHGRNAISWTERRSIMEGVDSDVHRVALSVVGAHAVAAAFQPTAHADGSRPLSLPSAVASAQSALNLGGVLAPAVRIEALAIVNELVHRVGVLEAALRKQLDGQSRGIPPINGCFMNPHKRLCLNLSGLHNSHNQPAAFSAGWRSPPSGASRTRFDFASPYSSLRNRDRASSASPCASNGASMINASVMMSPFATPSPSRTVADSATPR